MFTRHKRKVSLSEMATLKEFLANGGNMDKVSVSPADMDLDGATFEKGYVARNKDNHEDMWYVSPAYFEANFEEPTVLPMWLDNFNFGTAIEALKAKRKVARRGWNGKGMYLYMENGKIACEDANLSPEDIAETLANKGAEVTNVNGVPAYLFDGDNKIDNNRMPHIVMVNAQGDEVPGWLASQTDMFAEDWTILDN